MTVTLTQQEKDEALLDAIRQDDVGAIRRAVAEGADINARFEPNRDGFTALQIAIHCRSGEAVLELLQTPGLDINAQDRFGSTALKSAVSLHLPAIVDALLSHRGIDLGLKDEADRTVWDWARRDTTKYGEAIRLALAKKEGVSWAEGEKLRRSWSGERSV
jgi:ankyrin repeat protein